MNTEQSMISLKHVRKSFGSLDVLKDISLEVKEGEVVVIIGPSGSGKVRSYAALMGWRRRRTE